MWAATGKLHTTDAIEHAAGLYIRHDRLSIGHHRTESHPSARVQLEADRLHRAARGPLERTQRTLLAGAH